MTKEKIIVGNKLISEFMCFKISKDEISSHTAIKENNKVIGFKSMDFYGKINNGGRQGSWNSFDEMEFHTSWDWLMPVISKIEELGYFCMINKWTSVYTGSEIDRVSITSVEGNTKILNTWKACIFFIEWYNKNK